MKILVVDDDATSRLLVCRMLTKRGHAVVEAANGQQAWELFERQQVSLLISDLAMPESDGFELCARIRAANRKKYTYIIVLTALDGKANFLAAMNAGADDYLTKPLDGDQLEARLHVAERILRLQEEVKQLRLRVCSYCRRMLNERGEWCAADPAAETAAGNQVSHCICPTCWDVHVVPQLEALKSRHRQA